MVQTGLMRRFVDNSFVAASNLEKVAEIMPPKHLMKRLQGNMVRKLGSCWPETAGNKPAERSKGAGGAGPMLNELKKMAEKHGLESVSFGDGKTLKITDKSLEMPARAYAGLLLWKNVRPESFSTGLDVLLSYATDPHPETWARRHGQENSAQALCALGVALDGVEFFSIAPVMSGSALEGKFKPFAPYRDRIENFAAEEKIMTCHEVSKRGWKLGE